MFTEDLAYFRSLNGKVNNICSRNEITVDDEYSFPDLTLQKGTWTQFCSDIKRECYSYTVLLRKKVFLNHDISG